MEDERLLYNIAVSYYVNKMTQQEIADANNISRTKVFRLITEAQERGIIEVIVNYPESWHVEAEGKLLDHFQNSNIFVINCKGKSLTDAYDSTCEAAADYIDGIISNKAVFSVSRGKTMYKLVQHLRPRQSYPGMVMRQLSGLLEQREPRFEEMTLIRKLADLYSCRAQCFALPCILETSELRNQLVESGTVRDIFQAQQGVSIHCSSVSTLEPWAYHLDPLEYQRLEASGAVGCMGGLFLGQNGQVVDTPLYSRMISPSEKTLREIKTRICIASGGYKALPLLALLKSGLANVYFMDSNLAIKVLNLLELEQMT